MKAGITHHRQVSLSTPGGLVVPPKCSAVPSRLHSDSGHCAGRVTPRTLALAPAGPHTADLRVPSHWQQGGLGLLTSKHRTQTVEGQHGEVSGWQLGHMAIWPSPDLSGTQATGPWLMPQLFLNSRLARNRG